MDTLERLVARNLAGEAVGVVSYCTAHSEVIRAVCEASANFFGPVLIEATCNQVNQEGGYTGLRPRDFRQMVEAVAASAGLAPERLLLGGDHLGPNPWRTLHAADAMSRARTMVAEYASAGFRKLHLDASMRLGDDPERLDEAVVAERAAALCETAEAVCEGAAPVYVIGTEVPAPGGEKEGMDEVRPTAPHTLAETIEQHRRAFAKRGLEYAFERVIAIVAQPGVDFGNEFVSTFAPAAAAPLRDAVAKLGRVACEAHSTDYQPVDALTGLVHAHFAILKVGPELTAAYRRALLGLAHIEEHLLPIDRRSKLVSVLLHKMAERPVDWQAYYQGNETTIRRMQLFSYSDRVRYYWADPDVIRAVARLMENLEGLNMPGLLFAQYLPDLAPPSADRSAPTIARETVRLVVQRYQRAAGVERSGK